MTSSVRLKREQIQLVGIHVVLRDEVASSKRLLQRKFLEHGNREPVAGYGEASSLSRFLTMETSTQTDTAIQIWLFTAFSEVP